MSSYATSCTIVALLLTDKMMMIRNLQAGVLWASQLKARTTGTGYMTSDGRQVAIATFSSLSCKGNSLTNATVQVIGSISAFVQCYN